MGVIFMKNLILNHFSQTILAKNADEAIDFVNSLNGIIANKYTIEVLTEYFTSKNGSRIQNIWRQGMAFELATTGCGRTRIFCYKPQAETLKKHNEVIEKKKEIRDKEEAEKRQKREQEHLDFMYEPLKGWYVVTITGMAFKDRGNDGSVTKSVKVLADNRQHAYNKAVEFLQENPPKNVYLWLFFESAKNVLFEFVGVWTDEAEAEYY